MSYIDEKMKEIYERYKSKNDWLEIILYTTNPF